MPRLILHPLRNDRFTDLSFQCDVGHAVVCVQSLVIFQCHSAFTLKYKVDYITKEHLNLPTPDPSHKDVLHSQPKKRYEHGNGPAERREPNAEWAGAGGFQTGTFATWPRRSAEEQPARRDRSHWERRSSSPIIQVTGSFSCVWGFCWNRNSVFIKIHCLQKTQWLLNRMYFVFKGCVQCLI